MMQNIVNLMFRLQPLFCILYALVKCKIIERIGSLRLQVHLYTLHSDWAIDANNLFKISRKSLVDLSVAGLLSTAGVLGGMIFLGVVLYSRLSAHIHCFAKSHVSFLKSSNFIVSPLACFLMCMLKIVS